MVIRMLYFSCTHLPSTQERHECAPLLLLASPSPDHRGLLVGQQADKAGCLSGALQQTTGPEDPHIGAHRPVNAILILQGGTRLSWFSLHDLHDAGLDQ